MNLPYFVDEKNRKSVPVYIPLVCETVLGAWESQYADTPKIIEAIATVRKQPRVPLTSVGMRIYRLKQYYAGDELAYAAVVPDTFGNVLRNNNLKVTATDLTDTLNNTELGKAILTLVRLSSSSQPFNDECRPALLRMHKGLGSGSWRVEPFSPLEMFAQTQSFALFTRFHNGNEGYLDKNGSLGPLSKAQTYDSEEELLSALRRHTVFHYIGKMQVVKLNMQVTGVGNEVVSPMYNGNTYSRVDLTGSTIHEVAAMVQKRAIEQALEHASREQLDEAYKKLDNEEAESSAPKRRM